MTLAAFDMKPIPNLNWPSGIRLPVALTFEHQAGEGTPLREGRFDAMTHGQIEYGARQGMWNILEVLDRVSVKATFFSTGVAAEKYPDVIRAAQAAGHEIAGMSYSFEGVRTASREREKGIVRRTIKALSDVCGSQITGWRCPDYRISPLTFDVLLDEGLTWDSSMLNDDVPYIVECETGSLLEVPFTTSTADKPFAGFPNPVRGGACALADVWEREFNMLYRESERTPRFMIISMQTWCTGRPAALSTLKQFVEGTLARNDIKFARCSDIAGWSGVSAGKKA